MYNFNESPPKKHFYNEGDTITKFISKMRKVGEKAVIDLLIIQVFYACNITFVVYESGGIKEMHQ